jgi:hypothetical protein
LSYGGRKSVEHAWILSLAGNAAEFAIHPLWTSPSKPRHAANAEQLKIAQHCRTDGDQLSQLSFSFHQKLLDSTFALQYSAASLI